MAAASSYILNVSAVGKGGAAAKVVRKNPPLWEPKQFAVDQWFSQSQYFNVKAIDGDRITVENQWGNLLYVSRDLLEKMSSATHFTKEVAMNMTSLAELIETVSDTVFSVSFKKQANKESAEELLKGTKFAELRDKNKVAALSK